MSNTSIKQFIIKAVEDFKEEKINISQLKNSFEVNSQALEMMPYEMIKEIDDIEYKLTMSQFADEEGCETNIETALASIEAWLNKVPVESVE